jgi:hypothetical protein
MIQTIFAQIWLHVVDLVLMSIYAPSRLMSLPCLRSGRYQIINGLHLIMIQIIFAQFWLHVVDSVLMSIYAL